MGVNGLDPIDDNVDVEIKMDDGRVYSATFFTMENIKRLLQDYQTSGECANGTYIWAADMIIVNRLTEKVIRESIDGLIKENEITQACTKIRS